MNETDRPYDLSALAASFEERERLLAEHLARERELREQAAEERAERTRFWAELTSDLQQNAWSSQLGAFKSMAGSMAGLLGSSIKEQAKIMVPFELAEATREFARFLGSRDPGALASSLRHALAARQYAAVAKSAAGGAPSGGGSAGGGRGGPAARAGDSEPSRGSARVIVNVGHQTALVDTYEFARTLIDAINENLDDDVILEVSP